ncbi:MAG: GNAT family N-acetyltransferase [Flammeovirgaceae bacterium]|nr:GNAT family N-acetyltransferase [Flammeovirgaceae bacterium]
MPTSVVVRQGVKQDLPRTLELIKELAEYEHGLDQVSNTVARMEEDGFGPNSIFGFFVAECDNQIVGIAVYYYRYSTWKGRRLYLEDIVVTEKERGKGIGKLLFDRILQKVLDDECSGVMFQVLDWNKPAINFYKKYNTQFDGEWLNCHLDADEIKTILKSTPKSPH